MTRPPRQRRRSKAAAASARISIQSGFLFHGIGNGIAVRPICQDDFRSISQYGAQCHRISTGMIRHGKARLLIHERVFFADGFMIEIKVWRVPKPVPPTAHGLKYSLFYGCAGSRIVGYDNERGKGDHCHRQN